MMLHDIIRHLAFAPNLDSAVNQPPSKCYSIVPAAGRSKRMGGAKLLLPWGDGLLIDQVLAAWTDSRVDEVVVVVRKDDQALTEACRRHRVHLVHPNDDPLEMKTSVQCALREIQTRFTPKIHDRCFIAPADVPMLSPRIIDRLIAAESDASTIVVPEFGGKPGHPALLPWPLTAEIFELGPDEGIDRIVKRNRQLAVPFPAEQRVVDVDTPEEYERLRDALPEGWKKKT
ncbi:NTP transferase domain-containing protein [Stieleria sp.]|uniref:nucleotidyltransferase family protein n=1 Tax=Stieleria sp. TaxID=2795976 RepID=UPI003567C854